MKKAKKGDNFWYKPNGTLFIVKIEIMGVLSHGKGCICDEPLLSSILEEDLIETKEEALEVLKLFKIINSVYQINEPFLMDSENEEYHSMKTRTKEVNLDGWRENNIKIIAEEIYKNTLFYQKEAVEEKKEYLRSKLKEKQYGVEWFN